MSDIELAGLLARFRLQVRRQLDRAIDPQAMTADAEHAGRVLSEIEELTEDEDLLATIRRLRQRLLAKPDETEAAPQPTVELVTSALSARDYRFGARGG